MQPLSVRPGRAGAETKTAALWPALADPTRRRILDLLLERPELTGEIASHFHISRIAVMRHLGVLSEAGLIVSRKRGRERRYYLNGVTLQSIFSRWFDPRTAGWVSGILHLRDRVEARGAGMGGIGPSVDIAFDIRIVGSPAAVFSALTRDPGAWWGHPLVRPGATGLTLEPRLGGLFIEAWSDGGAVLAVVTQWATNHHLELTGAFHLGLGVAVADFDLVPDREATLLQFSFRAFGPVDAARAAQFSEGWRELLTRRLKVLIEQGTRLGMAPAAQPVRKRAGARRQRDG